MYAKTTADLTGLLPHSSLHEAGSIARVIELAKTVPAGCVSIFGFEQRLSGNDRLVDFAFNLTERGLHWIRESNRWPILVALCENWRTDLAVLPGNLWLEFDISRHPHQITQPPNVFFAFDVGSRGPRMEAVQRLVETALAGLPRETSAVIELIERCVSACPATMRRFHLGFMLARDASAFRFCALPLSLGQAIGLLDAVGWQGDSSTATARLDPYATPNERFYICSAATPPGGGVHGMCGYHAARSVLRRLPSLR